MKNAIIKHGIFIMLFCSTLAIKAQESINSGSGKATGSGSVSFSVGQTFFEVVEGVNYSFQPGVHQTFEVEVLSVIENTPFDIVVYPNPSSTFINISFNGQIDGEISYVFHSLEGFKNGEGKITELTTTIPTINFNSAQYILSIIQDGDLVKSLKILISQK